MKNTRHAVEDISFFVKENRKQIDSMAFVGGTPKLREKLRQTLLTEVPHIYVTSSVSHMLEVGNEDAGKGKTLGKLLELLHISPEEAMSFGDADNDIPMMTAVKYGFAMENGAESCKKIAFSVTDSNEQDGVAKAILQMMEKL